MNTESDIFDPTTNEVPRQPSNYFKPEMGDNTIRLLTLPLVCWSYWNLQNKPVRLPGKVKPSVDIALIQKDQYGFQDLKYTWLMVVWDFKTNGVMVWELNTGTIQNAITDLWKNAKWGSPLNYNLVIGRVKEKQKTKYSVIPDPPTPLTDAIKAAFAAKPCNLQALFSGGDPFAASTGTTAAATAATPTKLDLNQATFDKAKERIDKGEIGIIEKLQLAFNVNERQLTALRAAEALVGTPPPDDLPF